MVKVNRGPSLQSALFDLCSELSAVQNAQEGVKKNLPDAEKELRSKLGRLEQAFVELIEGHVVSISSNKK